MKMFTKEFIAEQRKSLIERENFYAWDNCISLEALDHIERLQQRIAELEAERRWIPVSERLPETRVDVLFIFNGDVCCGHHLESICTWVDERAYIIDGNNYKLVTHWQPLPQPPKEEE